jgi:hypothetical protein
MDNKKYKLLYAVVCALVLAPVIVAALTFTGAGVIINGDATVFGSLTKGSGSFVIDDPADPVSKILYHSFIESPQAMNIYDGIATLDKNGAATIQLPDYFDALNGEPEYQFEALDQAMPNLYLKTEEHDNEFTIAGGVPGGRISWQVTGVRHDPYILKYPAPVIEDKGPNAPLNVGQCIYGPDCD